MRSLTLIALSAFTLSAAAPAFAQDAMASHNQMKSHDAMAMGSKHTKRAKKTHANMSHRNAMKHGN